MDEILKELNELTLSEKAQCYAIYKRIQGIPDHFVEYEFKKINGNDFTANVSLVNEIKNSADGKVLRAILITFYSLKKHPILSDINEDILDEVMSEFDLTTDINEVAKNQRQIRQLLSLDEDNLNMPAEIKELIEQLIQNDFDDIEETISLENLVEFYYYALLAKMIFEQTKEYEYFEQVRDNPSKLIVKLDDEMYKNLEIIRLYYGSAISTPGNIDIIKFLLKVHVEELKKKSNDFNEIEAIVENYIKQGGN